MRNIFSLVLVISLVSNAQLLTENFNYTDGVLTLTSTGSGANVSGGNWVTNSGTGNNLTVSGTGLTYSGYTNSGLGKLITITASSSSSEDAYRSITTQTSGKVYSSLLINVANTTGLPANSSVTGDYFYGFITSSSTTAFGARLSIRLGSVSGFQLGIRAVSGNTAANFSTTDLSTGTTYLVVIAYEIVSGSANDIASLWVNPTLGGAEPSATITQTAVTADMGTDVGRIFLRQGTGQTPNAQISGISVGTSWSNTALPVELTSFTAITKGRGVELAWKTATETNNHGFEVERKGVDQWTKIGFVEGHGTTNAPQSYSFVDASAKGTVQYRLKQIDRDGQFEYHQPVEATVALTAADFTLAQNYPNPFNPATTISFAMETKEQVNVSVYNALGQAVATLFNGVANPNELYTFNFDGTNHSSGTYFYVLRSNSRNEVRKMSLLK